MSAAAAATSPLSASRPSPSRTLEVNLESLGLPEDTRARVLDAAPRGRVEILEDGTSFVVTPEGRLGEPLPLSGVLEQLGDGSELDVVVILGLGTGQLVRAVRALCPLPIVVYEPEAGVLRAVLEHGPLDVAPAVVATSLWELTRAWGAFAARPVNVRLLVTPGYYGAYREAARELAEAIPALLARTATSKATYQNRAKVWVQDIIENVDCLTDSTPFLALAGRYRGVPAFIIGAGPSLDTNVHLLQLAARKGIVLSTNSGAVSLAKHGVEPQVVCCLESIDASSKLAGLPFIDRAVRAFSLSAAPDTLRTGAGPLLPVHEAIPQYDGPLATLMGHTGLSVSGSVSTLATSLARALGCDPVVLVGQDLAYSGGRTYASGTGYETSAARIDAETGVIHLDWNAEKRRVHGTDQGEVQEREGLRRVPAWGGHGEVDSGASFAGMHHWFEATAELLQKTSGGPRLINATEGGVHIAGWEDKKLEEVLAELEDRGITAESIARDARERRPPLPAERIVEWLERYAAGARRVRRAARRLRRLAALGSRVTASGSPGSVARVYGRLEHAEAALRASVAGCPMVDAWAHRAIDDALPEPGEAAEHEAGPHRAALEANGKSARVALAIEQSAGELEAALMTKAAHLEARRRT